MSNLTEQWKKGELPAGEYYIQYHYGETTNGVYLGNSWENMFDNDEVVEVLAPVPSYEEWQAKDDALTAILAEYGKLTKELQDEKEKHMKHFSLLSPADELVMLEAENTKLKTEYEKECHRADELEDSYWKSEKENKKLKEEVSRESYKVSEAYCFVEELKTLLKECQHILNEQNFYRNTPVETDTEYRTRCLKKEELLKKIDEALK